MQNASGGFGESRYDIKANENGFSIRNNLQGTVPFNLLFSAPDDSLNVFSNGNVGLGVPLGSNALQALHIVRGDTPAIRLEQDASNFPAQTWDLGGNELGFFITNTTTSSTPFFIDPTGNVALGPSGPNGKLHVSGAGNQLSIFQSSDDMAVQFRLQTNSTNRRFVALNSAGVQQSQLVFGDNGAFDFLGATVGVVRMKILANGNVGIGTSTPDQTLSVNGNASKPGGGSWATFSDERLKNIKGGFHSGLEAVLQLEPIRYEYKDDNALGLKSEGEHIGFGAAAVQKVIPEAVTQTKDGYLMVDNDPILWTMLNAIKEQNAEIQQLKEQNKEIAELKSQLQRLQAEVVLNAGNKLPARKKVARSTR